MGTLLLPCDGSSQALRAVAYAVSAFQRGATQHVHLLNVQPPFNSHVGDWLSAQDRAEYHQEQGESALHEALQQLAAAGVPHQPHVAVGDKARCIVEVAHRLGCERILIGAQRKSAWIRALENSLLERVLAQSDLPVEVVDGGAAPALERVGLPAGLAAGLALLWVGVS